MSSFTSTTNSHTDSHMEEPKALNEVAEKDYLPETTPNAEDRSVFSIELEGKTYNLRVSQCSDFDEDDGYDLPEDLTRKISE